MEDEATILETEEVEADAEEVEAQEPEAEEVEAQPEGEDNDAEAPEDDDAEDEEPEIEEIEFNFNGEKLRVPKGSIPDDLATKVDEFVRGAESNTTRKFQELAEKSKAVEAREQAAEKLLSLNNDTLETYSRGLQVKQEIEQLSQVDLSALWQSNPDEARRVSDRISQKQAEFQRIVSDVSHKEAELTQAQQAEIARRKEEGEAAIEKQMKGFKTEKLPAVIKYATETLGIDAKSAEADWALNPAMTLAVHKAMLYDQMQTTAKKANPKPTPAKPIKTQKGGTGAKAQKDVSAMSAAEMAKHLGLPG